MAANMETIEIPAGAVVKGDAIDTVHGWAAVTDVTHKQHSVVLALTFRWGATDEYLYTRTEFVRIKR